MLPSFCKFGKEILSRTFWALIYNCFSYDCLRPNVKQKYHDDKVVFIGPCIAKKRWGTRRWIVWWSRLCVNIWWNLCPVRGAGVDPVNCEELEEDQNVSSFGRCFAKSGGVSKAIKDTVKELDPSKDIDITKCNGITECKKVLEKLKKGKIEAQFIEGMACQEGCIGGPFNLVRPNKAKIMVEKYGEQANIKKCHWSR